MLRRHVTAQLVAYCHGTLEPDAARRVAAHLDSCPRCQAEYTLLQRGDRAARLLPRVPAPDRLWTRIEAHLPEATGAQRAVRGAGKAPSAHRALRTPHWSAVTVVLLVAVATGWWIIRTRHVWSVTPLAGSPTIDGKARTATRLEVGQWLATDAASRARLQVAQIGSLEVGPNTRLRRLPAAGRRDRLELRHGLLDASIVAPPGAFAVATPAAVAVDLGCAYRILVDDRGATFLRVAHGRVGLTGATRSATVSARMTCEARPGLGPGTPLREDAPPVLRQALARFDFGSGDAPALTAALAAARPRDAITLWNLLSRVAENQRRQVFDRLAALSPPPSDMQGSGTVRLNHEAMQRWLAVLELEAMRPSIGDR